MTPARRNNPYFRDMSYDYVFVTSTGSATPNPHKNNLFLPRGSCENLTLYLKKLTPHDDVKFDVYPLLSGYEWEWQRDTPFFSLQPEAMFMIKKFTVQLPGERNRFHVLSADRFDTNDLT